MPTRYTHTNIIALDPVRLGAFYAEAFDCTVLAEREHSGEWLDRGTGLEGVEIHVVHLRLPGHGESGPTIEIFGVGDTVDPGVEGRQTRRGLMHMAFAFDDIHAALKRFLRAGGKKVGEITDADVEGVGRVSFMYGRDPEGNIVELQQYR
jgi:predicted enzyme related to lactoylglutathione lyase